MPSLYIITGSNGAGKSSVGSDYLPPEISSSCTVFDGDKLFMEKRKLLWNEGIRAHKEVRNIAFSFVEETFNNLVDQALKNNTDFTYEGHFTNDATWDIPKRFKAAGYNIHLIFFGLRDTDLSELRVIDRSKEGGHYVDPLTISDNFYGNLEKLNQYFAIFDSVQIIDTSGVEHIILAILCNGIPDYSVTADLLPAWFINCLPEISKRIIELQ